jgi:hypothetical protein
LVKTFGNEKQTSGFDFIFDIEILPPAQNELDQKTLLWTKKNGNSIVVAKAKKIFLSIFECMFSMKPENLF